MRAIQTLHGARMDKIGDGVDKLIEHKSAHGTFTPGIVMALMGAVFVAFLSISEYISLQLAPIVEHQSVLSQSVSDEREVSRGAIEDFQGFRAETHYEVATMEAFRDSVREIYKLDTAEKAHMDDRMHLLDARIRELEQEIATNTALLAERSLYVQNHNRMRHANDPT
tara:strand:- start:32 stop:535 length:504 start_codon:yes stop_codon:yes gene_type:complete